MNKSSPNAVVLYRQSTEKLVNYSFSTKHCPGCRKPRSPTQYTKDPSFCNQCMKDPYILYRVRKLDAERGPWYTEEGKHDPLLDLSMPFNSARVGLLSCVDNMEDLLAWFKPELPLLLSSGFGVFKYRVIAIEHRLVNKEIIFSPTKVIEYSQVQYPL